MYTDKTEWKPNPQQAKFLAIPTTIPEAGYGGGNASGKSDVLIMYGIVHRWHEHPLFKQVFMRRTYPELKTEIVPRMREVYPKFGATFNKTDMVWTFPRPDQFGGTGKGNEGATIWLGHCENEDDVHKWDTVQINLFTPDELTTFTEFIYLHIAITRVRTPDNDLPAITRWAGMPGGIGHSFVKKRFIDPAPKGGKIIIGKGGNKRIYIHATVDDNPHADKNYAQRLEGIPSEAERKARRHGDWNAYMGQVFDELREKKYPDEPDNALHVIKPFQIPEWWPRMVIGDWGYRAMTYIGFYAISPNQRVYLYRELSFVKTKISIWAPQVRAFMDREYPRVVKFCKSAGQDRGQEHTIQQQLEAELLRPIELSVNSPGSRVAGKNLIHEYLRWTPKPIIPVDQMPIYSEEYAMWVLRNKGENHYQDYLNIFKPAEPETNIPKLQIFRCESELHEGHPNCCPLMIGALQACVYAKPRDNKPAEDVEEFDGDDPYDDLRYAVDSAESYFAEAGKELEKAKRVERIVTALKNTNDWTAYYRQMNQAEQTKRIKVVQMYHRRPRH
jgi:hypothetical protein